MINPIFNRKELIGCATLLLFLIALLPSGSANSLQLDIEWNEYRSEHFLIHFHQSIPKKYIREFTRKCEQRYYSLVDQFGFSRCDFLLKPEQIEVFLYRDKQDYLKQALPLRTKLISSFYFDKDFFSTTLLHRLSQIMLREFIGSAAQVPAWFEQGVAGASEEKSILKYFAHVKGLINSGNYLGLPEMEKRGAERPGCSKAFAASSASVVIFLLEEYGKGHFMRLCRELKNGSSFYTAMNKAYQINGSEDLDIKFTAYLNNKSFTDIAERDGLGP